MERLKFIGFVLRCFISLPFYLVGLVFASTFLDMREILQQRYCFKSRHWFHITRVDRNLNAIERKCRLCNAHQFWDGKEFQHKRFTPRIPPTV